MNNKLARISKFLSLVLHHKPETIGLSLDQGGWAQVDELLEEMTCLQRLNR
jgi:putative RNA 2'-phosphotransferase